MDEKKYSGLTVSIPLFFNKDESIDYHSLDNYIKDLSSQSHISAVYSMAYNTRYRMLSDEEVLSLNKRILDITRDYNLTCYVGHPYIFNRSRLQNYLMEIAKHKPAGISMLYPERYYGIDEPLIEFFNMPSNYGLKVVLHEMKLVSGFDGELINWPKTLIQKALEIDSVIGIKEDSKDDQITQFVLDECKRNNLKCILAGGGKTRALKFIKKGLDTWLNGTTMFLPKAIDYIYPAIMNEDINMVNFYVDNIERPFFEKIVKKYGWHLAHKAALEFFGYGSRHERFPHSVLTDADYNKLEVTLKNIKISVKQILNNER